MATRPDSVGGWSFFSLFLYPCRQGPLKIKALGDSLNLVTLGMSPMQYAANCIPEES